LLRGAKSHRREVSHDSSVEGKKSIIVLIYIKANDTTLSFRLGEEKEGSKFPRQCASDFVMRLTKEGGRGHKGYQKNYRGGESREELSLKN